MTISERLFDLLAADPSKSAADLCRKLNINTSVTTNWKNRNTDPAAKYIVPICEYLDVSVMFLLTGEDDRVSVETIQTLSSDERRVIEKYRSLDDDGKDKVRGVLLDEQRRVESNRGVASNTAS